MIMHTAAVRRLGSVCEHCGVSSCTLEIPANRHMHTYLLWHKSREDIFAQSYQIQIHFKKGQTLDSLIQNGCVYMCEEPKSDASNFPSILTHFNVSVNFTKIRSGHVSPVRVNVLYLFVCFQHNLHQPLQLPPSGGSFCKVIDRQDRRGSQVSITRIPQGLQPA